MPVRPTAGHPTLSDACAALARDGRTSAEIAAKLGIDASKASALTAYRLGKAGINRQPAPAKKAPVRRRRRTDPVSRQRTVAVDHAVLDAFAPHAARRAVSVNEFVRQLLAALTGETTLIDNILDEAADLAPQPQQVSA